jgi:radical SAM protein with 4Fe4S-binding SPASM domain
MNRLIHLSRMGWEYMIRRKETVSCPPYQYTIEPTNCCNLRCAFCPQSDPAHRTFRPVGYLTLADFGLFLDRIRRAGSGNRNINLTLDGEPLLNRDFPQMISLAVRTGFFPVFASNGTLVDRDRADRLIAAGPFRASIDFASDENIYETIRGGKGDFRRVRENLTYLMEASRNGRGVHLDVHDITPYAGCDPDSSLTRMRALFPPDLPRRVRFATRRFHNFCGHLPSDVPKDTYRLCPYPWVQMAVTWNGDCVPCCRDTAGRTVLGNIFTDSVMTIWNSEPYRRLRRDLLARHPDHVAACRECDLPFSGGQSRWRPGYMMRSLLKR